MVFIHLKDKNEKKVIINCFFINEAGNYQIGEGRGSSIYGTCIMAVGNGWSL